MINIKKLNKFYYSNNETITIYKNLDFEIKKWDFIAIVGKSWSGKTTLLNLIAWLDWFSKGEIEVNKNPLSDMSVEERTIMRWKNISFIFQQFNLVDNLTVKENIDLIIELNNLERRYETEKILKIVGLENKAHSYPYNLSGGEQQRIAVARAFVWKTPILLADEPTWNLDEENTKIIINLIKKLHKDSNNTIVMITHDMDIANEADRIYEIKNHILVRK